MYEIFWKDEPVGQVKVEKEGLYIRFHCSCIPPNKGLFRVRVNDGASARDLGICVPEGERFTLSTRVPAKYLKEETLSFQLVGKDDRISGIPVATGEPFSGLEMLDSARLQVTSGQAEIVTDSVQGPPDSDPSQEY